MPRKNHNINLVKITVSVHPLHVKRMDDLLSNSDWGFSSQSDIVRQSLSQFFRKVEPEYTKLTPLQEEKVLKISEKRQFIALSDEEYAKNTIKGIILNDTNNVPHIVMHWFGNTLGAKPLDGCKEWFSTRLDIVENHLQVCSVNPIEKAIRTKEGKKQLKNDFDIIVPDNE